MKTSLRLFLLSLAIVTALIFVNRWDIPGMVWLCTLFGLVGLLSGCACLADLFR